MSKRGGSILGFSIGRIIGWKAALSGLKVSSTRLRYENQKPLAKIGLFYGESDAFMPNEFWFQKQEI